VEYHPEISIGTEVTAAFIVSCIAYGGYIHTGASTVEYRSCIGSDTCEDGNEACGEIGMLNLGLQYAVTDTAFDSINRHMCEHVQPEDRTHFECITIVACGKQDSTVGPKFHKTRKGRYGENLGGMSGAQAKASVIAAAARILSLSIPSVCVPYSILKYDQQNYLLFCSEHQYTL